MNFVGLFRRKTYELRKGHFAKSVSKLVSGTAGAQLLGIIALPFLTRLYSPADFKVLAAYTAVISIASVCACLRYDFAIPLPRSEYRAANLLVISLISVVVIAALATVAVLVVSYNWTAKTVLGSYLWLVPVGIALAGVYSAAQLWATRNGWYGAVARTRVSQVGGGILVQLSFGLASKAPLGLLLGHALSGGIGGISLLYRTWKKSSKQFARINFRSLLTTAAAYKKFPKYSIIDGLSTNAGSQLPILLIATWGGVAEAGYLLLASKLIATPVQMISGASSQVFLATAPDRYRRGELVAFTARVSRNLVLFAAFPLAGMALVAAPFITVIFGAEWRRASEIFLWMIPWYSMRMLSAPISMVMNVIGRQKIIMRMKVGALFFRVAAVVIAYLFYRAYMVEALAIASFLVYLYFGVIFLRAAGVGVRDFLGVAKTT